MQRREFLYLGTRLTLASVAAFNFGCSLQPKTDKAEKIALIYGTRYGATRDTAGWIAAGTGKQVELLDIERLDFEAIGSYDLFIIGSGIWIDGPHKRLLELLQTHKDAIQTKIIASFIVCGTTGEDAAGRERLKEYFARLHEPLDVLPPQQAHFGGRMIIDKLNDTDRELLAYFYTDVLKKPFVSWDKTQPQRAGRFGTSLVLKGIET